MSEEIKEKNLTSEIWDFESDQNWVGFWDLLLKEDMRQNPHLYKSEENKIKDKK